MNFFAASSYDLYHFISTLLKKIIPMDLNTKHIFYENSFITLLKFAIFYTKNNNLQEFFRRTSTSN